MLYPRAESKSPSTRHGPDSEAGRLGGVSSGDVTKSAPASSRATALVGNPRLRGAGGGNFEPTTDLGDLPVAAG